MNTICQDRDITVGALASARIGAQSHARAIMCRALENARFGQHLCDGTHKSTQEQVGKNRGGSWQSFANWIQLADRCQLNSITNQRLSHFPVQLAVGKSCQLSQVLVFIHFLPLPKLAKSPPPTT